MGHGQKEEGQERSPGRLARGHRGKDGIEEGDGARVRDAATNLESSREEVDVFICLQRAVDHAEQVGTRPSINWGPPEWWWIAAEAGPRA